MTKKTVSMPRMMTVRTSYVRMDLLPAEHEYFKTVSRVIREQGVTSPPKKKGLKVTVRMEVPRCWRAGSFGHHIRQILRGPGPGWDALFERRRVARLYVFLVQSLDVSILWIKMLEFVMEQGEDKMGYIRNMYLAMDESEKFFFRYMRAYSTNGP